MPGRIKRIVKGKESFLRIVWERRLAGSKEARSISGKVVRRGGGFQVTITSKETANVVSPSVTGGQEHEENVGFLAGLFEKRWRNNKQARSG